MSSKKIIAMWSGPRNISTAMMRSFENRKDTAVIDEPFYSHYLSNTKLKHPGMKEIMASQSTDWSRIVKKLIGRIPNKKKIWYQKHMAHHNLDGYDLSWTFNLFNCFLIRNPAEVITSYSKQFPIKDHLQLGYNKQAKLFKLIRKNTGRAPPVIDAKDILLNPKKQLTKLCQKVGIKFKGSMISWPMGSRESDGVWATYWYQEVNNSCGFKPYIERKTQILKRHEHILRKCIKSYEFLYNYKI